jgi:hypothetical protein
MQYTTADRLTARIVPAATYGEGVKRHTAFDEEFSVDGMAVPVTAIANEAPDGMTEGEIEIGGGPIEDDDAVRAVAEPGAKTPEDESLPEHAAPEGRLRTNALPASTRRAPLFAKHDAIVTDAPLVTWITPKF